MLLLRSGFLLLTLGALVSKSSAQAETGERQCLTQRAQCANDTKVGNVTAMRGSCQKCFHTCLPLVRKKHDEPFYNWNYCLDRCVEHDCVGSRTADGELVTEKFRCKVYGRQCWSHFQNKENKSQVIKSCGACAKVCNFRSFMHDQRYCESRCSAVGLPCGANDTTITSKTNNGSKAEDSNTQANLKGNEKLWKWLRPVLSTVATIISIVIVVVLMLYFQRKKAAAPGTIYPNSSLSHPIEQEYDDERWANVNGSTGATETFDQGVPRSSSSVSKFFSNLRRFRT